jgi:drug/metabolite transporter (DMT)-like permease
MTKWMCITLGLAVVGQVVYQIGQRAVPLDASPLAVLTVAYFAAGLLCLALAWPFGAFASGVHLRSALAWPTWIIAISIVAIEVGFLTAYRSGWTLGTAFAACSTATLIALAVVDWLSRGGRLSATQLAGLACSCAGVWLLSVRAPAG